MSPMLDMEAIFSDSSTTVPLVLVAAPGMEPFRVFHDFARIKGFSESLETLCLGQDQVLLLSASFPLNISIASPRPAPQSSAA